MRVRNLDKHTYAGNLHNLASLNTDRRHGFVRGDIGDGPMVDPMLALHRRHAVIHFATKSQVDHTIHGLGECMQTNAVGTLQLLELVRVSWGQLDDCARSSA